MAKPKAWKEAYVNEIRNELRIRYERLQYRLGNGQKVVRSGHEGLVFPGYDKRLAVEDFKNILAEIKRL